VEPNVRDVIVAVLFHLVAFAFVFGCRVGVSVSFFIFGFGLCGSEESSTVDVG
jgi:hypothetical protein